MVVKTTDDDINAKTKEKFKLNKIKVSHSFFSFYLRRILT